MSGAFHPSSVLPSKIGRNPGSPSIVDGAAQEVRRRPASRSPAVVLMGESDKESGRESRKADAGYHHPGEPGDEASAVREIHARPRAGTGRHGDRLRSARPEIGRA